MSAVATSGSTETKTKKKRAEKRVGPACSPETAPNGCGRPLPVSAVPKDFDMAAAEKRLAALQQRIRTAKGIK